MSVIVSSNIAEHCNPLDAHLVGPCLDEFYEYLGIRNRRHQAIGVSPLQFMVN